MRARHRLQLRTLSLVQLDPNRRLPPHPNPPSPSSPILLDTLFRGAVLRPKTQHSYNCPMAKDTHPGLRIPPTRREALEDRKLLDRPSRAEMLQSDSWRVLRITSEFVTGFEH